jgi:hypothetical protein
LVVVSSGQDGKWVAAGASDFINFNDREVGARYLDAFDSIRTSGLIRRGEGNLYVLSGSGFKVARELRVESRGRIWTVPIPPNPLFTGRALALARIEQLLSSIGTAALVGLGGVGKTQTAARYAHLRRDHYDAVLWATAASREALVSDFVAIAARLGVPQMGAAETVAAVERWLETHENWLLVLDNADDLGRLGNFIPSGGLGHVLLTTQAQATGTGAPAIEVTDMEAGEGGFFVVRRAKLVSQQTAAHEVPTSLREAAEAISTELGGLLLALDQAGAFVEESACGLSAYLDLYRERRAKLLERRGSSTSSHPDSVAATFALAFEKIEQASPAASDVLRLCAFLSPDVIPEEIFTVGCMGLGANLESVAGDTFQFNDAVVRLLSYSLVRRDPSSKMLIIHRLVQAVLQDSMGPDERRQWADRAVRAVSATFPKSDFGSRVACERLIRHAELCGTLVKEYGLESPESARLLNEAGAYLIERARFKEAKEPCGDAQQHSVQEAFLPAVLRREGGEGVSRQRKSGLRSVSTLGAVLKQAAERVCVRLQAALVQRHQVPK